MAFVNKNAWKGSSSLKTDAFNDREAIIMDEEIQQLYSDFDENSDGSGKGVAYTVKLFC